MTARPELLSVLVPTPDDRAWEQYLADERAAAGRLEQAEARADRARTALYDDGGTDP